MVAGIPPTSQSLAASRVSQSARSTWHLIAAGLLLLVFAGQNLLEMRQESATTDEVIHLPAGYSYLALRDFRMNPEHPPLVKILAALPLLALHPKTVFDDPSWQDAAAEAVFGYRFLYANDADLLLFWARLPMVLIGVLLGFYVFRWTEQLYGAIPGLFALGLYAFSPNLIAHAHLVTMDVAVGAFLLISFYYLWRHLEKQEKRALYWSALAMGAALAGKFSAVALFPVALLFLWLRGGSRPAGAGRRAESRTISSRPDRVRKAQKARNGVRFPASGSGDTAQFSLHFERKKLAGVLIFVVLAAVVVQLSYPGSLDPTLYFKGMSQVNRNHDPDFHYYLHGSLKPGGYWYYFLVAFLVKATAPFIILVLASLVALIWKRRHGWRNASYLVIPSLVFLSVTSAMADPLGVRYILPVFPFLMVFSGSLVEAAAGRRIAYSLWILLGWHIASSVAAFPYHLPYFNEFVGGPSNGTRWLDDSNVDWGQGLKRLKRALDQHGIKKISLLSFSPADNPEFYGIQCTRPTGVFRPVAGYYALSAHVLARNRASGFDWSEHASLVADVGHSMFIFRVGGSAEGPGSPEDTLEEFTQAVRHDPNSARAHNNLGNALQGMGRLEAAAEQYREALRLEPDFSGAHYNLGNALQRLGRLEEAAEQYREAIREDPESAEAQGNLGASLIALGRLDEAAIHLKEAVRIRPGYDTAYNNLGIALLDMGHPEEALAQFREALRIRPDFAEACNSLGDALQALGRFEEAVSQHRGAIRLKPDLASAYFSLGTAYQGLGRYEEAIAQYKEVLRRRSGSAEVCNALGVALAGLGKIDEAAAQFREALRLKPDYADARANLNRALKVLKKNGGSQNSSSSQRNQIG